MAEFIAKFVEGSVCYWSEWKEKDYDGKNKDPFYF